jgi:molybdenum cofactor cytidylyltransferase
VTGPPPPRAVLLVLAAGASSRMRGADKLLEPVEGEPLIVRSLRRAVETGLPVIVALDPGRPDRLRATEAFAMRRVEVADAAEGMGASLRAAVSAAPEGAPLVVHLADMPDITAEDILTLVRAFEAEGGDRIVRAASSDGRPGQPVVFPARLRPDLLALTGDTGGREILRREDARLVPLPGRRALVDLDTPEDFAAWREAR